jgi:ribosomal protein L39E
MDRRGRQGLQERSLPLTKEARAEQDNRTVPSWVKMTDIDRDSDIPLD